MSDAISREGTSCWLEAMGYPKLAKAVMNEKRFPSVLGTNLAEVSTDLISRQAAIETAKKMYVACDTNSIDDYEMLMEEALKVLPPVESKPYGITDGLDVIGRQAAINALAEDIPSAYTPDGSHPADEGIFMAQEIYADCIQTLKELPPVEPQIIRCKDCKHWIPYDWMFSEEWQSKNMADYSEDEIGCVYCDMVMKANDFCSRGERRTE
jgi:hypothetical protein